MGCFLTCLQYHHTLPVPLVKSTISIYWITLQFVFQIENTKYMYSIRWIVYYLEERAIHIFNNPGNEMFDSQFFVTSAINPRRTVGN